MPSVDVEIRPATLADFEAMVDLDQASAEHHAAIVIGAAHPSGELCDDLHPSREGSFRGRLFT